MAITTAIPIGRTPDDYLSHMGTAVMDIINKSRDAAMKRAQMEELAKFHGADLNMRERALNASHQFDDLKRMILEQQLKGLKNKNDPMFEIQQLQNLMQMMSGQGSPEQGSPAPQMPDQGNEMPFGQGQGMLMPNQQPMTPPQQPTQPDFEMIKNNPILRGFIKQKFGVDLGAETPDQKQQRMLDFNEAKLKQKEEFDKAKEMRKIDSNIPLTNAMKTQLQNIIAGVPKVNKKIDDLIAAPSPTTIIGYRPDARAHHASLVLEAAESYAKAKGWPNTNESIKAAREILDRHTFESDDAYRKRLRALKKSLDRDLNDAHGTLHPTGETVSNMDISQMSDEELQRIASGG